MAKTDETVKLERNIWNATNKLGTFGCFEVTIGWDGRERVDYITYDTTGIWRCFEVKVSKSDFYSKAKKTFVGHFNYFVLPDKLYNEVKQDIPSHVGVYLNGNYSIKRAKKQDLLVDEQILKNSMIRSLSREFQKQYKSGQPHIIESLNRRLNSSQRETKRLRGEMKELRDFAWGKYGRDWDKER